MEATIYSTLPYERLLAAVKWRFKREEYLGSEITSPSEIPEGLPFMPRSKIVIALRAVRSLDCLAHQVLHQDCRLAVHAGDEIIAYELPKSL